MERQNESEMDVEMSEENNKRRISPTDEKQSGSRKRIDTGDESLPNENSFNISDNIKELIISYLIRFLVTVSEPLQRKGLHTRIQDMIQSFFSPSVYQSNWSCLFKLGLE